MIRGFQILTRRTISLARPLYVKEIQLVDSIQKELTDSKVTVTDISNGCGTNFEIKVISNEFEGKRPVNRQRMVNRKVRKIIDLYT